MFEAILHRLRRSAAVVRCALLAAGCAALASASQAQGPASDARDLTVEQAAVHAVEAPDSLGVTAWVDHADNTYALGERVRLFVKASKDAWITVLNVGPSGRTTILFPNAHQRDNKISGSRAVEIPSPRTGASIKVNGPTGRELIKVIATTSPTPLFAEEKMRSAGPFATLVGGARGAARDLQVTMDTNANQEWDDYNQVITTVASR